MKKMLMVDDDAKLQDLLRTYLEAYGFTVRSLLSGMKIMEAIQEDKPDIIILDIMMPGKDGLEVLKEIRSRHSVPVIMLTARRRGELLLFLGYKAGSINGLDLTRYG